MDLHHTPYSIMDAPEGDDLYMVHRLLCNARDRSPSESVEEIKRDFENYRLLTQGSRTRQPGLEVYRTIENNEIVGMTHMTFLESMGRLKIDALAVDEKMRKQGYGWQIMQAIHSTATILGAQELRLDVAKTKKPAFDLYQRAGFEVIDNNSESYHRMAKTLDS